MFNHKEKRVVEPMGKVYQEDRAGWPMTYSSTGWDDRNVKNKNKIKEKENPVK